MSAQTLRDNAARFRKDNSSLSPIEVRDGNDVELEAIHIKATEPVRRQETSRRMKKIGMKSWKTSTKRKMEKLEL